MHLDVRELAAVLFEDLGEQSQQDLEAALSFRLEEAADGSESAPPAPLRPRTEILRHLMACPRCRRRVVQVLEIPAEPEEKPEHQSVLAILFVESELEQRAAGLRRAARPEDETLLAELLRIPPVERLAALEDSAGRFLSPGLAEILISGADREMSADRLSEARHLAFLASSILENLPATTRHRRLLSIAYCAVADIQRRCGVFDGAEDLLATAARHSADDYLLDRSRARLCRSLALLRQDQGRIDEALALLERSRWISNELGADEEQAQAALALGWLLLEQFEPQAALEPLWEAYNLLDEARSRDLLSALHALLLANAEGGNSEALPELLTVLRGASRFLPESEKDVGIARIEAQIAAAQGDHLRALSGFVDVFRRLSEKRLPVDAAAAALVLVRHTLEKDLPSNRETSREVLRQLNDLDLPPEVEEVVNFAIGFALKFPDGYFMEALVSAELWLQRARFNPQFPYFPLADPEALVAWNRTSNQERKTLADDAGVELLLRHGRHDLKSLRDRRLVAWTHEARTGKRIVFPDYRSQDDDTFPD